MYAYALNNESQASGWQLMGTWASFALTSPAIVSVSPINGSGSPQTFNATYASNYGASDLNVVYLLINTGINGAGACFAVYQPSSNILNLVNDAGSGYVAGTISPGAAGTLSNSQCTLGNAGPATLAGSNLTLPIKVTFAAGFFATKNIYAYAVDNENLTSGWQLMGTWSSSALMNPTVVSVTPINGSGSPQTFNATYASNFGAADLNVVYLLFNTSVNGVGACFAAYQRSGNLLYLYNDAGTGFVAGTISPGTAGTLSNSQCTLGNAGPVIASGTNLTLPINIAVAAGFSGTKNVYGYALDNEGKVSGWQTTGTWTTATNPTIVSVTPINGNGSSQTFNATYASNLGAADLNVVYLLFNTSLSGVGACFALYQRSGNLLYLYNDSGTGFVAGSISPGAAGTLSNSQCTIGNAGAVALAGNSLTLPVSVTFAAGFTGTKNVYAYAGDNEGLVSGWQNMGTWTPVASTPPTVVSVSPINGAGSPQTFNATYASNAGATDLNVVYLLMNTSVNGASACFAVYQRSTNLLYLINDAGSGYVAGSISPGTAGTLANSQCTIGNAGAATLTGTNLKLPVAITFAAGFTGAKNVYANASNNESLFSGWQLMGTWTGH